MNVLFFDPTAKSAYTSRTLTAQAMGASEGSLMRVARALAMLPGYSVFVFQAADQYRREMTIDGVKHVNADSRIDPDVIVHQRTARFVEALRQEYPKTKHVVWMHDAEGDWLADEPMHLADRVVCVSQWHANTMPTIADYIYNPVELDGVAPLARVPGRLGFFSSPQKGLAQVVALFQELQKTQPGLELVVANPGYLPDVKPKGVTFLGQLSHPAAMRELSKCSMLFYPQCVFPETMGVVLAEANALSVPVLAHDMGAAREVLEGTVVNSLANKVIDCADKNAVLTAATKLLEFPPVAEADPRFTIGAVVEQWRELLEKTVLPKQR